MPPAFLTRYFWHLFAVLFVASGTKHLLTLATGSTVLEYDALDYWQRGVLVSEGDWLQIQGAVNYRGPLYPTLLGICRRAFGSDALLAVARPARTLGNAGKMGCALDKCMIHRLPSWLISKPDGRKQTWRRQERQLI